MVARLDKGPRWTSDAVLSLGMFFFEGWMLMLFLGGVHHEVLSLVKPIGYWTSCILSLPLGMLIAGYLALTNSKVSDLHEHIIDGR